MTVNIGTTANIDQARFKQETSHPSSPASGYELLYTISGSPHGGLFVKDSAGRQIGPFITGTAPGGSSVLVQKVTTETGAVNTGSTLIPLDDTIPQNNEGDEYMTRSITPTNASNILYITVTLQMAHSFGAWHIVALFQDTTADALAAVTAYQATAGGGTLQTFTHKMVAGTTSPTTFKVRAGGQVGAGGTTTFNGQNTGRLFGGVMASSIVIEEVTP